MSTDGAPTVRTPDIADRLRDAPRCIFSNACHRHNDDPSRWCVVCQRNAEAADEIEALRSLIRGAVEIEVLDDLGWRGRGVSMSLLPGEWSGVIARALDSGSRVAP